MAAYAAAIRQVKRAWGFEPLRRTLDHLPHNYPRIALVGCTSQKLDTKAPAGLLYSSRLFNASLEYAARTCDGALVLSAKHGVLELHEMVEPYDLHLGELTGQDYQHYCSRVSERLRGMLEPWHKGRDWRPEMVVLAGERYWWKLERPSGWTWSFPLEYSRQGKRVGMGLGERHAFLRHQLDQLPERDEAPPLRSFRCSCGRWHLPPSEGFINPRGGRPVCVSCRARINEEMRAEHERAKEIQA